MKINKILGALGNMKQIAEGVKNKIFKNEDVEAIAKLRWQKCTLCSALDNKGIKCAAISKSGSRCKKDIEPGESYCTIHAKVEQRKDGEKKQCTKIKSDGKRCKMKTSSKSGLCYYHD